MLNAACVTGRRAREASVISSVFYCYHPIPHPIFLQFNRSIRSPASALGPFPSNQACSLSCSEGSSRWPPYGLRKAYQVRRTRLSRSPSSIVLRIRHCFMSGKSTCCKYTDPTVSFTPPCTLVYHISISHGPLRPIPLLKRRRSTPDLLTGQLRHLSPFSPM